MRIVHISDTHRIGHGKLTIPECDLLLHTGDIGGRTDIKELTEFLIWFERQPAEEKIFIAGNHDVVLDKPHLLSGWNDVSKTTQLIMKQQHEDAMELIEEYDVKYLCNTDYVYDGVKIFGSPYTPSFHRKNGWAFNADRGEEILKQWAKIPSDTDVLITHGPPYGILDEIPEKYLEIEENDDIHRGCKDLIGVIKKRLLALKLVCFGHIHDQVGIVLKSVSNSRRVLFSNGAVLTNDYTQLVINPLIITI